MTFAIPMRSRLAVGSIAAAAMVLTAAAGSRPLAAQTGGRGTLKGRIRLTGPAPGNTVIRMGMDPMCAKANAGKRVVQDVVAATADGGLANVFVKLQGSFPNAPLPPTPVLIDQRGCVYVPRVIGVRVGQTLQIRNSDPVLHNVHSLSDRGNAFNVGQPMAGIVSSFKMKDEEVMLRIKCDVHSWMTTYVGVVTHPYFAVSRDGGTFEIANVPAGTHTIQAWQERYGTLTQKATVKAGATTTVDFVYTGTEKGPGAR
jgi:plastocyanin